MKLKITIIRGPKTEPLQIQIEAGITLEALAKQYQAEFPYRIMGARVNHKFELLQETLRKDGEVRFLDLRSPGMNTLYQRSVSFVFLKALNEVIGPIPVEIENSLSRGLFTIPVLPNGELITEEQVRQIEARMREIQKADIPFVKSVISREDAEKLLTLNREIHPAKLKLLMDSASVENVHIYDCGGFQNFFYGWMLPSTGYVEYFELRRYEEGIILRFPNTSYPDQIPPYVEEKKLYQAFDEAKSWCGLMGVSYVHDLNRKVKDGSYRELIQISEALHEKKIAEIADMITQKEKHIVLIAGPSSSGKTTFAHRLCIQLCVNGKKPLYLGMDDYFKERSETPRDADGKLLFEDLEAIDMELFNNQMNALLRGEAVDLPSFDFKTGSKVFGKRVTALEKGQPIVIEGIHALNPALSKDILSKEKFNIYISPFTQINIDNHNRISTTYARLLRRIVRDYQFRGYSAQATIERWPDVRAGEDKNIFPFNIEADAVFNSVHIYELAVLKKYAMPLLQEVDPKSEAFSEAYYIMKFLSFFRTIKDDSMVANNSILREFIGGSVIV